MKREFYISCLTEISGKEYDKVAEIIIQRSPSPAIVFKLNGIEILKLEPSKFTSDNEILPDIKSVYNRLDEWISEVEHFGN